MPKARISSSTFARLLTLVASLLLPLAAHADEYAEVNRLLGSGSPAEALARAERYLAGKPRDPQMRFLKAVVLAQTGRSADAAAIYRALMQDYPELPEPYNNLAVLYAGEQQYGKAREALEMAIRAHPGYATAHENLGDVYLQLARQSYGRAVQLDPASSSAQSKLAQSVPSSPTAPAPSLRSAP